METKNPLLVLAAQLYKEWGCGTVSEVLIRCINQGVVIINDNLVVIGERCRTDGKSIDVDSPKKNCWVCYLFVSDSTLTIPEVISEFKPLKYLAFKRNGKGDYRIYDMEKFRQKAVVHGW